MKFLLCLLLLCYFSLISAHVTISPTAIPSSGTTFLTFNVPHSCEESALTYKIVMHFPPNITSIKPVIKAGWMVNQSSINMGYLLPSGVDAFTLIYTYTALPGNEFPTWTYDSFLFRVTAPTAPYAWPVGSKFYIPTYQYCTNNLLDAWNVTNTASSSESGPLPAPSFTILDPSAIQVTPTQSNVQALASQLVTVMNTTSSLNLLMTSLSSSSSSSSSSDWLRADTISIIAIILSGVGILGCLILLNKLLTLEKQNLILRKKLHTLNEITQNEKLGQKDTPKENVQLTPLANHTTQPSTSEGHAEAVTFQLHE